MPNAQAVTTLLGAWRGGDAEALNELTPLVYDELRRLAGSYMGQERAGHTLQATALVNEAFLRLAGTDVPWADRAHFFAVAARTMRRILIDYAKSHKRDKRGGGLPNDTFNEERIGNRESSTDILDVDDALERLAAIDPGKSEILVLHYFGGLTYDEMAEVLDLSTATIDRHLRFGKAWLANELKNR
ncbi:MAG: sigma-70 family RNA polymerase sigma factor [Woeseia sp.]